MKKAIPFILFTLMAAWLLSSLRPAKQGEFHYADFGRLPLLFNGRLQPMDSLARNSLLQIRDKQSANLEPWKEEKNPKIIPAIEWLATMMMNPSVADQWPVIRIDNPDLVSLLKLPSKNLKEQHDGKHFSWAQIEPAYPCRADPILYFLRVGRLPADSLGDTYSRETLARGIYCRSHSRRAAADYRKFMHRSILAAQLLDVHHDLR